MAIYPIASGQPDLSSSGLQYAPKLYAARLLIAFYAVTCLSMIANTDFEGEVQEKGDKVVIRTLPEIEIKDHVDGQPLEYQNPTPSNVELLLNKGKYWAFNATAVQKKQSDIAFVDKWASDGASRLKIAIETGIFADIYSDVHASNAGATAGVKSASFNIGAVGSPVSLTKSNIVDYVVNCGTILDEQDVPEEGRWLLLPPWACGLVKKSDLKDASLSGDGTSILRNGRLGMIDRFTIYKSNNLYEYSTDSATHCLFGHKVGLTFASQMTNQETLKNPQAFGDLVRALQVYGYKVVKSEAIGDLYAAAG